MKLKLKKVNAGLAGIATWLLVLHTLNGIFTMFTGHKSLQILLPLCFALVGIMALHMILSIVFMDVIHDKAKQRFYPVQNKKMSIQRLTGTLTFVLTIAHIIISTNIRFGTEFTGFVKVPVALAHILYSFVSISHACISFTGIGIAFGKIRSDAQEMNIRKKVVTVGLSLFAISVMAVIYNYFI